MSILGKASGILGINARNLNYLARYNSHAKKRLADDKIYTKRFLQARGVGVAKLYESIRDIHELRNFNPHTLPHRFVIKPNHGYGGEGIIAIIKTIGEIYYGPGNDKYTWPDLYEHCISILDGRFAVSGLHDSVIFEELLEQHEYFNKYSEGGLPDIRIIVFKYVPVIAMLRLPTAESHGKANLHLGAIGCGIDIGTGKTTFGVYRNKIIRTLPNGEPIRNIIIPDWDNILLTAAQTQFVTQIGYLAVDIALTKTGIKILELNARAGLAIQISNQSLLRRRLDKLRDVKVISATEGVKLGKSLFTRVVKKTPARTSNGDKQTLGLFEYVNIINANNATRVLAKIDPHSQPSTIDKSIELLADSKLITIKLRDKKIKLPFQTADFHNRNYQMIIGGRQLTDFLIDASRTTPPSEPRRTLKESKEEKIIQNIDKKIVSINESVHLVARLKPHNLLEQKQLFLKKPEYSPQFIYKKHDLNLNYLRNELKKIPRNVEHPLMPLYLRKIEEIENKLSLVERVGSVEFIPFSQQLFGRVTDDQYQSALRFLNRETFRKDSSKLMSIDAISKQIKSYLKDKKLTRWKIQLLSQATSGMQINKNNTIFINKKAKISANRLKALIAHEIETHIFRLENARRQPYRLFEQGTAGYLLTEEGLAIYNQNKLNLPLGEKYFSPALNIIAIHHGQTMSFVELYYYLFNNFNITKERSWQLCVRTKRGLEDTGQPGALTKDRVYYIGYQQVKKLIEDKGLEVYKKLYVGKIGIPDLIYITDFKEWPINYLPTSPTATR